MGSWYIGIGTLKLIIGRVEMSASGDHWQLSPQPQTTKNVNYKKLSLYQVLVLAPCGYRYLYLPGTNY